MWCITWIDVSVTGHWQQPSIAWPAWTTIKGPMIVDKVLDGIQRKKVQETSYLVPQISFFSFFLIILFLRLYSTMNNRDSGQILSTAGEFFFNPYCIFLLTFLRYYFKLLILRRLRVQFQTRWIYFLPWWIFLGVFPPTNHYNNMYYSEFSDSIITR